METADDKMTVVILDDEPQYGALLKRHFNRMGFLVRVFTDSEQMLKEFKDMKHVPEVFLIDYFLGRDKGPEVVEKLKLLYKDTLVIGISGLEDPQVIREFSEKGCQRVLSKNNMEAILETVCRMNRKRDTDTDIIFLRKETNKNLPNPGLDK